MNILPPSFKFDGDKDKAISLKAYAGQFYNLITRQAAKEGLPFINRTKRFPDGTVITFSAQKNSNFKNWSGRVGIFAAPNPPSPLVLNKDIFVTKIDPTDINNRYVYSKGVPPELKLNFYAGGNYWIEKKRPKYPERIAMSWEGGNFHIGGRFCNIGGSLGCYSRALKKIVIISGSSTSPTIRLYNITGTVGTTEFSVSLHSTRSLPKNGNTNIRALGFLEDGLTLFAEGYSNTNRTVQTLNKYVFSADYTTQTITQIWSGGATPEVWDYSGNGQSPAAPTAGYGSCELISTTFTNEYFVSHFIYQDRFDAVFHKVETASGLRETNWSWSVNLGGGLPLNEIIHPYKSRVVATTTESRWDKYYIRYESANTLIDVFTGIFDNNLRSHTDTHTQEFLDGYMGSLVPSSLTADSLISYDVSLDYKVPLYVNSKINLLIYEEHLNTQSFSHVPYDTPTNVNNSFYAAIKLELAGNTTIISSSTQTPSTANILATQFAVGQLAIIPSSSANLGGGLFRKTFANIATINDLGDIDAYRESINSAHIVGTIPNISYAFDEKILLTSYTLGNPYNSVELNESLEVIIDPTFSYNKYSVRWDDNNPLSVTSIKFL